MELSQYCLSPNTRAPFLHKGSPTENYVSLWIYGKSTDWLRMTILTTIIQLALCQTQHNIWQVSHCSAKYLFSQAYHCLQMSDQRSVERARIQFCDQNFAYKRLAQGLSRSVTAFQVSCANIWTQFPKLSNVLKASTKLELQPTVQFEQSSSVVARQDWDWWMRIAILDSEN